MCHAQLDFSPANGYNGKYQNKQNQNPLDNRPRSADRMDKRMKRTPVLFVGHGSPMNAVEDNVFSQKWAELGKALERPKAILSVSAHWFTADTRIADAPTNRMIYDMYGFPDELYRVVYPAPGAPEVARRAKGLISRKVELDNTWGLDHGTWSVLRRVFPRADIPVFQLSVDYDATPRQHFEIGQELAALRDEGVLILGSGNVVHNLGRVNWGMEGGYDWAQDFDGYIKRNILNRDFDRVVDYHQAGPSARQAFPTLDHFAPLLYVLGATDAADKATVFNDACAMGSLSMTSYLFE